MDRLKSLRMLFAVIASLFLVGATSVSALTKNIAVSGIIVKEKSGTITVVDPVLSDNEITSNITFNQKDDFVTFELSLENKEAERYKVESVEDNNTNNNIRIDYSYGEDFIDTNDTGTIAIKLTYENTLINVAKVSINDLTIKIHLVSEEGKSEDVIINPNTGDTLPYYLAILAIAVIVLAILFRKKKVAAVKIGGALVALSLFLIPLATLASGKYEIQIKFTDIDIIGEFETYNISINPGNGDEILVVPVQYGNKLVSLPANPSKDGYDFDKWVDGDGNEVTTDTVVTGPMTVEAKYTIKEYSINYDLNGGSLPSDKTNPDKYTILDEVTVNNPEKQGYTFTGWSGTGIDGKTTNLVIPAGSKDERSYVANYSANENTPYTVTHRYQNLDDLSTYTEENVTEYGETDKTIPAPRQERTGFETPQVQNVKVEADGSAHITYTYNRETYSYSVMDRTYITSDSTSDGTYSYGTTITAKAQERAGYTFAWNDGNTNYERSFELTEAVSLTPVYTANTDTPYVVNHYKQKLTLDGYEIADTQNLTGTTDAPISPAVNSYIGFKSPAVQHTTIAGDGSTKVDYYYDREIYAFSFNNNANVTSSKPADNYPYGTVITLTANTVDGKTFSKWSNNATDNPLTITLTGNLTIEPIYTNNTVTVTFDTNGGTAIAEQIIESGTKVATPADPTKESYIFDGWFTDKTYSTTFDFNQNITQDTTIYAKFMLDPFPTVFKQEGACIFNGVDGVLEGENCAYANGENKYIDTGVQLYNAENHDKDYEIGFTIESYKYDDNVKQATIMNTKLEGDNYPGIVFRKYDNRNDLDLSSRRTTSANARKAINYADKMTVKIYRITNEATQVQEIFYSINGGEKIKLNDLSQFNPEFNTSVWFGAAPVNTSANTVQRILVGTLSNMYIKLGEYGSVNYTVTHQKQKINSDEYEIDETEFLAAKPGTSVTPETKNYTGFEAPDKQTVNISEDGDTKIIYSYTRNKYNLTVKGEEFIEEGDISGEYYYGDTITLTAKEREGYTFDKWNNGARDSRLILTKDAKDETIYAKYIPTIESDKLYDAIKNQVIDLGGYEIDFTKAATEKYDIAESNGNGVNKYTEKDQDIYYYRGEVDNNNVIWADTCWKIIRTTYTGGVKMIYNGLPSEMDGIQQCNNRGVNITYEGKTDFPFNTNDDSPADVGYMYGARLTQKTISADSTIFIFANDVSYDPETKIYNLITGDDKSITGTWSDKHKESAKKYHYFCTDGEESCDGTKIGYIHDYGYGNNFISYLEIAPYANIEEAKAAMFANENDSNAKRVIEGWFEQANLDGHEAGSYNYENDLEDAIFCNDRTLSSGPLASKDSEAYMIGLDYYAYNYSYFGVGRIKNPSLDCPRQDDAFTKTDKVNGNGMLKHKVGLITADELNLVGYSDDNLYSEWINWALTPGAFGHHGEAYMTRWISGTPYYYAEISWSERIRPVVSLKAGAKFKKGGNGTKTNPYVIERFEN